MSVIHPRDPRLLTDDDVLPEAFACCGDEDVVFVKCPGCRAIMVFCFECDTLFPEPSRPDERRRVRLTAATDRLACPRCGESFPDRDFLAEENVDRYLVSAEEVIAAGYEDLLVPGRRERDDEETGSGGDVETTDEA